jgi:RNA polymerase sigma factor (sigma-70 family)
MSEISSDRAGHRAESVETFVDSLFCENLDVVISAFRARGVAGAELDEVPGLAYEKLVPRLRSSFGALSPQARVERFPSGDCWRAYLYRCADNLALDLLRKKQRKARVEMTESDLAGTPEEAARAFWNVAAFDPWVQFEHRVELSERLEASRPLLQEVTSGQGLGTVERNVAILFSEHEIGGKATAARFGVSAGRISQIKKDMKAKFGEAIVLAFGEEA